MRTRCAKGTASSTSRQQEIASLLDSVQGGLYPLFPQIALACSYSGAAAPGLRAHLGDYKELSIADRAASLGLKLEIKNAPPAGAFGSTRDDPWIEVLCSPFARLVSSRKEI